LFSGFPEFIATFTFIFEPFLLLLMESNGTDGLF
jgi:hypothetical protein